jgi:hypothetical protein
VIGTVSCVVQLNDVNPPVTSAAAIPVINAAQADLPGHTITISGVNFGTTRPTVSLDALTLSVTSFSKTTIKASLPAGIGAGSYHLAVVTGPPIAPAVLDMTIGTMGPGGPPGPAGPSGPPGLRAIRVFKASLGQWGRRD